jgi:hypothetical protein
VVSLADNDLPAVPALDAPNRLPGLRRQTAPALLALRQRVAARLNPAAPRPDALAALEARIREASGGVVALEGPPGSGATTLLCALAARRPWPIWLPEDDAGLGLEALCAQVIALHDLPLPLVPPAAGRDGAALERLLAAAAATRAPADPLAVLIGRAPEADAYPGPPRWPAVVPPGVTLVWACARAADLPLPAAAAFDLLRHAAPAELRAAALAHNCPDELAPAVAAASNGSFLYVALASGLLRSGPLRRRTLPPDTDALLEICWRGLGVAGRRLLAVLAAAGEPLLAARCAELAGLDAAEIARLAHRWRPLLDIRDGRLALAHPAIRRFVAGRSGDALAGAHAAFVNLARARCEGRFERLDSRADADLARTLARHAALSDRVTRVTTLPALASRAWVLAQERRTGGFCAAAEDAAWELRIAAQEGHPARLIRAAALAGSLAALGRSLPAEALAEAFGAALARGMPREAVLREVRALIDQLADGRGKAVVLRRLGEACHEHRLRAVALRMLSEALDLEAPGLPRSWREQREETLAAFARAAVVAGAPHIALGITVQINHAERRGLIETEVVRWLLGQGQLSRAEEVALAIGHESMHEWAMAEVAVAQARAGHLLRAEEVLSTLKTETAVAWARSELACDAARAGDAATALRLAQAPTPHLRDEALAAVARALVEGGRPEAALEVAGGIAAREVRAQALIDLGSPEALARATADVAALGDDRLSLVVALAAALAAHGDTPGALAAAALLPEGEERDRAHSRVALALGQRGDPAAAHALAAAIPDADERDWTLHELARLLAGRGDLAGAAILAAGIIDTALRARADADLRIAEARCGDARGALARLDRVAAHGERVRAFSGMAGALVAQGAQGEAVAALAGFVDPTARSRCQGALAVALAAHGAAGAARRLADGIPRPVERARALVGIARAVVTASPDDALAALGLAFRDAASAGRAETFAALAQAADTLVALGGPELLLAGAGALDEIDGWWE